MSDSNDNKELTVLEQARALQAVADAETKKIEVEKEKNSNDFILEQQRIEFQKQRDERLYNANKDSLAAKEKIAAHVFNDRKWSRFVWLAVAILVILFLSYCVHENQISFFIPLFKYLASVVIGGFGGYGYARHQDRRKENLEN